MAAAAAGLEYERAALLRDQISELKSGSGVSKIEPRSNRAKYPVAQKGPQEITNRVTTVVKAKTSQIHFLTGSDEAAVRKAASALARELAPGADVFGLETIDGAVDSVDAAAKCVQETMQSLLTLPFLGGSKLVWLKNASFLADNVAGRSESVLAALEKLCEVLNSGLAAMESAFF